MRLIVLPLLLLLSACSTAPRLSREAPGPSVPAPSVIVTEEPGPDVLRPRPWPGGAAPGDSSAPATPALPASGLLGETLAGLGAPGEAGMWLRTGLVDRVRPGRVVSASGQSQAVELRPSGTAATAGSHLSLAAMRALGLNLGQLATLRVYAD